MTAVEKISSSAKMLFSFVEDEKLVEFVSKYPCLYDLANPSYKNQSTKDSAWKEVAETLERSVDDCKKRWRNIKDTYIKRKKKGKGGTGTSASAKTKPWPLYEMLSFLEQVEHKRLSTSNIDVQESQDDEEIPVTESTEINEETSHSSQDADDAQSTSETTTSIPERNPLLNASSRSQTSKKQKFNDNLFRLMESRQIERAKIINSLTENREDEIDVFFKSIAMSVKKFRPELQNDAKLQTLQMVIDLERRNNTRIQQTSSASSSYSSFVYSPSPPPPSVPTPLHSSDMLSPAPSHMPAYDTDPTTDLYQHDFTRYENL